MRFPDLLSLARDNLSRARLRTVLTATGVAIGTAAVVLLISVGNGAEGITTHQLSQFGSLTMVLVSPHTPGGRGKEGQWHELTPALTGTISGIPHVAGVTTSLNMPPLRLTIHGHSSDLNAAGQTPLNESLTLTAGSGGGSTLTDGLLLPASIIAQVGLTPATIVGQRVVLTAGGSVVDPTAGSNKSTTMLVLGPDHHFTARVAGIYDDSSTRGPSGLFVSTTLAATIDGQVSGVSGVSYLATHGYQNLLVHTDDARQTTGVAAKISALNYQTQDRADLLAQVQTGYMILKGFLGAIGGVALLVAAVGIANTMIMSILERTREIGIMKALGAEPATMRWLFLTETGLIGVLGGVIGLALALAGSTLGNLIFPRWLQSQGGGALSNNLFVIPGSLAAGALLVALAISLIAGSWPSRRAVRLQPLDALRYE